jgi:hypothetical protein
MTKNYFRNIPDFEYVNRTKDGQFISNYTQVKNFFKKGKLRDDLFQDLTVFEKYSIKGDDRPDNVANECMVIAFRLGCIIIKQCN